jgi:hypothetical protein
MRTASRQRSPGRLVAFFSGLAALIFARACLIEIEAPLEPRLPDAGVGGSTSAGGSAGNGAAGSSATGGSVSGASGTDAGDAAGCPPGQKRCERECVSIGDPAYGCGPQTCESCGPNGQCGDGGTCLCNAGWVDCNNDAKDGCEVQFGPAPTDDLQKVGTAQAPDGGAARDVFGVVGPNRIVVDGNPSDWPETVPMVALQTPCARCQDDSPSNPGGRVGVTVVNPNGKPLATDLEAYFRVTWSNDEAIYVLVLVKDDQVVSMLPTARPETAQRDPAETQDGAEILINGDNVIKQSYDTNDHHVFIGAFPALDQSSRPEILEPQVNPDPPASSLLARSSQRDSCYFVEIALDASYLLPENGQRPIAGTRYGFSVAVNDWDVEEGQTLPARAHQLFWKHPGIKYADVVHDFPQIELRGP